MAKKEKSKIVVKEIKENPEKVWKESYGSDVERVALVKRIEKNVRASGEYRDLTFFLRNNLDMNSCAFFRNVSKKTNGKIKVEIHHAPLTLFDIAWIVLEKHISEGEEVDDLLIAEEVAELHYENQVGLIPLSKTLHELAHSTEGEPLVIPLYMVYGKYTEFLREYKAYWEHNDAIKAKLDLFIKQTAEITSESFDMLQEEYVYLKVDGFDIPIKIGEVDEEVVERLNVA